jgi:hypothetical protein
MPIYRAPLYLPSTQAYTGKTQEVTSTSLAIKRTTLRHGYWCDHQHLCGRDAQKLHRNHAAFLKEWKEESEGRTGTDPSFSCQGFVLSTFRDVLDAVILLYPFEAKC